MSDRDSLDKIVTRYLAAVSTHALTWRGTTIEPKPLRISPLLLRGFTCPAMCGGCCPTFTLDYLPSEARPYPMKARTVVLNDKPIVVFTDEQRRNKATDNRCIHLDRDTGRCGVHGKQPFSCDFELIRFSSHEHEWRVAESLFGRGSQMKRVDGGVGALCTVTTATRETIEDVARRLRRLHEWAEHFRLEDHRVPALVDYCERHLDDPASAQPLTLN